MQRKRRSLADIEEDIQRYPERKEALKKERIAVLRSTRLSCPWCEKRSTLRKWTFIQTYHYERPHGCTEEGGDWQKNSLRECWVRCPRCGKEFYLFHTHREKIRGKILDIVEKAGHLNLSELFDTIEDVDEDNLQKPLE